MSSRMPGFHGEYLWELGIPEKQLLALAAAVPNETYSWRPAEDARSFAAVLVHVATANFMLLRMAGVPSPATEHFYGALQGDQFAQIVFTVRRNLALENALAAKEEVIDLLERSFDAVRRSFSACTPEDLEQTGSFFGETTTVRRVYLRILAHAHEHMGQAIAYARASGTRVPWPDALKQLDLAPAKE
ncbi:MAG TPA: DinB family protein [Terracidiphilus sp.]|nr:DinB family protein [Terracidiphilus sp.]